jgi:hypothetical protein
LRSPDLLIKETRRAQIQRKHAGELVLNRHYVFESALSEHNRYLSGIAMLRGFLFRPWFLRRYVLDALFGPADATVYDLLSSSMVVVQYRAALAPNVLHTLQRVEREVSSLYAKEFIMAARALIGIYTDAVKDSRKRTPAELAQRAFNQCRRLHPDEREAVRVTDCTYFKHGVKHLLATL